MLPSNDLLASKNDLHSPLHPDPQALEQAHRGRCSRCFGCCRMSPRRMESASGGRCKRLLCAFFFFFVLIYGGVSLGDVFQGVVIGKTGTSCPLSADTGRQCRVFNCGDRGGPSFCGPQDTCLCKPGYCAQDTVCQLNTTSLKASVVPVNRAQPTFPGPHGHVRTALCVSGGGTRSMSNTLGALRALEHLGLMDRFDAISSVSGGAWASAIYMFANKSKEEILGDYKTPWRPDLLTPRFLVWQPSVIGTAASGSMKDFLKRDLSIHSKLQTLWGRFVSRTILAPAGLDDNDHFMAANEEAVRRIKRDNPSLEDQPFVVPHPGRPKVFVMSGTIMAPPGYEATGWNAVSMQMSPDYTGSPFYPDDGKVVYREEFRIGHPFTRYNYSVWVGGGFVETFAFGGEAPEGPQQGGGEGVTLPPPQVPFTLADALAISSAAFGKLLAPAQDLGVKTDPQALIWPVLKGHQDARTYLMGDGGNLENAGLLAMLQRGARRMVWLMNTDTALSSEEPFCWVDLASDSHWDPRGKVTDQVTDKFGFGHDSMATWLAGNQVFAKEDLPPLLCKLQGLIREGRPAVVRQKHRLLPNSWWGIRGGYDVEIMYVYNAPCKDFSDRLPERTRKMLESGSEGPFAHFPYYKTTFQNEYEFTALTRSQITLLAALTEYSVLENADELRQFLEG